MRGRVGGGGESALFVVCGREWAVGLGVDLRRRRQVIRFRFT